MRNICFAALLFCCLAACSSLREGDLLFHVASQGNNITDVTPGMTDHVAICLGGDSVVEAIPGKGVVVTPLGEVLHREEGYYVKGRVKKADAKQSVAHARRYLGLPYDSLFLPGNDAIYCSELVQLSMVDKRGKPLLQPVPMSFHDASGRITDYWTKFYERFGLPVPEGQPGTNPGELQQRRNVKVRPKSVRRAP